MTLRETFDPARRSARSTKDHGPPPLSQTAHRPLLTTTPSPTAAFVSARTDELWLERNAISSAVASTGVIPLVFDGALNKLADDALESTGPLAPSSENDERAGKNPRPDSRTSGKRSLRDQIDSLLDAADFFVGIYSRTSGLQEYAIGWLTWVEYELYRFLMRQLCLGGHGLRKAGDASAHFHPWCPLEESEVETLNGYMRSKERIEWLRSALQRAALGNDDSESLRVRRVLESRTLLFQKRSRDGGTQLTYDLQEFLLPIRGHLREVRTTLREAPGRLNNRGDFHYFPAHARLFQAVRGCLHGLTGGKARDPHAQLLKIHIVQGPSGKRTPGILYPVLREIFQRGLSICAAFVGCSPTDSSAGGITCYVTSSRPSFDPESESKKLQSRLSALFLQASKIEVNVELEDRAGRIETNRVAEGRASLYRISLLDSPGALWSVCTLVASYGGSISFLCLNPPDDSVSLGPKSIAEPRPAASELLLDLGDKWLPKEGEDESEDEEAHDLATFEYQLQSLHAVHAVH